MKTYTALRNKTAEFCNVSTSDTVKMAKIDDNNNDSIRTMCNLHGGKLRFSETTKNMTTVATQAPYQIPNSFRKLIDMYIYSGSAITDTLYTPEMIFDPTKWKRVLQTKMSSSDVPSFTYVENRKFYIYPTPATTGNLITLRGRLQTKDLTIADYTTGTIVSVANEGTAVVGSGTAWTTDMVGRYIQITETTADLGGDGFWYEIAAVGSATTLTLTKPYEGTAIATGAAVYAIGQTSPIPEAYDVGICYRSAAIYWQNQDLAKSKSYWLQYDGGNEAGLNSGYGGLVGQMIVTEGETEEGSYIPPFGSSNTFPSNQGPYYYPYQDASGF